MVKNRPLWVKDGFLSRASPRSASLLTADSSLRRRELTKWANCRLMAGSGRALGAPEVDDQFEEYIKMELTFEPHFRCATAIVASHQSYTYRT